MYSPFHIITSTKSGNRKLRDIKPCVIYIAYSHSYYRMLCYYVDVVSKSMSVVIFVSEDYHCTEDPLVEAELVYETNKGIGITNKPTVYEWLLTKT
jgi:hypothetical protein